MTVIGRKIFYEPLLRKLSLENFLNPVNDISEALPGKLNLLEPASSCGVRPGDPPSSATGRESLVYIDEAVGIMKKGLADALVTAPVSKKNIASAIGGFSGHTNYLADKFGVPRDSVIMMIVSNALRVVLLSQHIPVSEVADFVKRERIVSVVEKSAPALKAMGFSSPRFAVAALNPHSGDGGLFGREEIEEISPAVDELRKKGFDVAGPLTCDVCVMDALKNRFDAIVAMYHDQGICPVKILANNKAVNFTVGLPFVRVSPLHGTAFDIAGKFRAWEDSILKAVEFAAGFSKI